MLMEKERDYMNQATTISSEAPRGKPQGFLANKGKAQRIISRSPEETCSLAGSLLNTLGRGSVLALHGDLGSGKTCFVHGLAHALGIDRIVASPTFTLVNEYVGRWPLYHIDLYRMRGPDDVMRLGLEEYLESDGITAIEWAEKAEDLLPENAIHMTFEILPDQNCRAITFLSGR